MGIFDLVGKNPGGVFGIASKHRKDLEDSLKSPDVAAKEKKKKRLTNEMRKAIIFSDNSAAVFLKKKGLNPDDFDLRGM